MFIIVPIIIIFLCLSYLYLNDTSMITDIIIYSTIFLTIFISFYLYNVIQKDLKQQEKNSIQLEINQLINKLNNTNDPLTIKSIKNKIDILGKEIDML